MHVAGGAVAVVAQVGARVAARQGSATHRAAGKLVVPTPLDSALLATVALRRHRLGARAARPGVALLGALVPAAHGPTTRLCAHDEPTHQCRESLRHRGTCTNERGLHASARLSGWLPNRTRAPGHTSEAPATRQSPGRRFHRSSTGTGEGSRPLGTRSGKQGSSWCDDDTRQETGEQGRQAGWRGVELTISWAGSGCR